MFIRFVSSKIDEDSHLPAGLFQTAYKLLDEVVLPDYEYRGDRSLAGGA